MQKRTVSAGESGQLQPDATGDSRPQPDINSDDHQLMRNYHGPQDETLMVEMLPSGGIGN